MRTVYALIAAGQTDTGRQRTVNEDRFYCDAGHGLFIVIDGIGGQAAGGKAADIAISTLRTRLEREIGTASERVREAIALANNEIFRVAGTRPQWGGMACVLTVAVVDHGRVTIGHVGDTRLYKLHGGRIEKITRDHSPVGEREDSKELSELEAMQHPRRNEVYRDVGSQPHEPDDPEFIDIDDIPFEPDAALLLCSDGLSDLIDSATIADVVSQCVGEPEAVARALIEMANAAGGKDNVTVVYVEGEKFAASQRRYPRHSAREMFESNRSRRQATDAVNPAAPAPRQTKLLRNAIFAILLLAAGFALARRDVWMRSTPPAGSATFPSLSDAQVVKPGESLAAAVARAAPGSQIIVEPGEYRERLFLKDGIRLVSRIPRGATIRLPGTTADGDFVPAVVADGVSHAELTGFRIIGDAATPLGVGVGITGSDLSVIDVEILGATRAGIEFGENSSATLLGSEIHDNPGAAIFVRPHANPRITNNVFSRNGMSERASGSFVIDAVSTPVFQRNVFVGLSPDVFLALDEAARSELNKLNWFLPLREPVRPSRSTATGRQSRP
jgi:serine/threonine protein phosphatase PrpC